MVTITRWTGRHARILREVALRMSIHEFAEHTNLSTSAIRDWENKGEQARLRLATQRILDQALNAAPDHAQQRFTTALADTTKDIETTGTTGTTPGRVPQPRHPEAETPAALTPRDGDSAPLDPELLRSRPTASVLPMVVAGGRTFTGSVINARIFPAGDDGRIVATLPEGGPDNWAPGWPGRELLVGAIERETHVDVFGIDSRRASRQLTTAGGRLPIPQAYQLDDLTVGLLWAVTNLDTSLLGDDAQLASCHDWISKFESQPRSSTSRDAVASLSSVSQMWLGSEFCARHVLRHCDTLADLPAFWTREQHGEEASTWLLFTHKYDYLKQLAHRFRSRTEPMTRTFSITETAITTSPPRERVLLLLAVALMESFGIQVNVCLDTAYRPLEGFVLDRQRCAIIANWVDTDAVWHVDVNTSKPDLRRYADALDHGQTRSAIAANTPGGRLTALAGLLDLDWDWLVRRSGELATYGSAGIAEPHSRLLSTAGVDRACAYLATVAKHNR